MVVDVLTNVKESVIEDFFYLKTRMEKADYSVDFQKTLNKILFIESAFRLDAIEAIYSKLI